jgi:hypothetical protein
VDHLLIYNVNEWTELIIILLKYYSETCLNPTAFGPTTYCVWYRQVFGLYRCHMLSQLVTYYNNWSHVITTVHMSSQLFTLHHKWSHVITNGHILSQLYTCYQKHAYIKSETCLYQTLNKLKSYVTS